jgi:hypothetical protein
VPSPSQPIAEEDHGCHCEKEEKKECAHFLFSLAAQTPINRCFVGPRRGFDSLSFASGFEQFFGDIFGT